MDIYSVSKQLNVNTKQIKGLIENNSDLFEDQVNLSEKDVETLKQLINQANSKQLASADKTLTAQQVASQLDLPIELVKVIANELGEDPNKIDSCAIEFFNDPSIIAQINTGKSKTDAVMQVYQQVQQISSGIASQGDDLETAGSIKAKADGMRLQNAYFQGLGNAMLQLGIGTENLVAGIEDEAIASIQNIEGNEFPLAKELGKKTSQQRIKTRAILSSLGGLNC